MSSDREPCALCGGVGAIHDQEHPDGTTCPACGGGGLPPRVDLTTISVIGVGWRAGLRLIEEGLSILTAADVPVVDMPDAAGRVRAVEVGLAGLRRGWNEVQVAEARDPEGELPSPVKEQTAFGSQTVQVVGEQYRTVTQRSARRTFNTAALLHGMVEHGQFAGTYEALAFALRERLAEVRWRWSDLNRYARTVGLPLKVVAHAVADDGDLDGPWIGETWTEQVRQEAVREGES